jgi:hypothetical protein
MFIHFVEGVKGGALSVRGAPDPDINADEE